MPKWVTEYYRWHQDQLRIINPNNWDQHKYLILRCLKRDSNCKGASDRLQPIPLILLASARSEHPRLLFIQWEQPFALEEFLVPNLINWTLPSWLDERLQPLRTEQVQLLHKRTFLDNLAVHQNKTVLEAGGRARYGQDHGARIFNRYTKRRDGYNPNYTFQAIYHNLWESLFQPSLPVQKQIDSTMKRLGFNPNQYSAMHMRLHYLSNEENVPGLIDNATSCGIRSLALMKPQQQEQEGGDEVSVPAPARAPLYVASDSRKGIQKAISMGRVYGVRVVARDDFQATNAVHLNGALLGHRISSKDMTFGLEAYYDIFVDLYLLAKAQCNVYGRGGFGKLANLMSYNSSCYMSYFSHVKHKYRWPLQCFQIRKRGTSTEK